MQGEWSFSPTLKGEKVTLRQLNPESDCIPFFKIMLDEEMHRWTGNEVPNSQEDIRELLQRYKDLEGLIAWGIEINETKEFVGTYWIAPIVLNGKSIVSAEAQRIGRKFWRTGITKEVRSLVYDFAFYQLGVEEVHAQAWKNNCNSCLSMERAGFTLHNIEEKIFTKQNEVWTEHYYILYKRNYKKDHII